jgi:hypothetical protein
MKLFDLEDEMPVPSEEVRIIKEFKALFDRDQSKKKQTALKEMAFVYFYAGFDSRFEQYKDHAERVEQVRNAVDLPKDWKPDTALRDAVKRYKDLIQTRAMSLVKKMAASIEKIENFLESVDLEERNDKTNAYIYPVEKLIDANSKIPNLLEQLIRAEKIVEKEMEDKHGRAGRDISITEQRQDKVDESRPV